MVTTANKQLNFVPHTGTMLDINGRAAVVLRDHVLLEGGDLPEPKQALAANPASTPQRPAALEAEGFCDRQQGAATSPLTS